MYTINQRTNHRWFNNTYSRVLIDTVLDVTEFGNQGSADCIRTLALLPKRGTSAVVTAKMANNTISFANMVSSSNRGKILSLRWTLHIKNCTGVSSQLYG